MMLPMLPSAVPARALHSQCELEGKCASSDKTRACREQRQRKLCDCGSARSALHSFTFRFAKLPRVRRSWSCLWTRGAGTVEEEDCLVVGVLGAEALEGAEERRVEDVLCAHELHRRLAERERVLDAGKVAQACSFEPRHRLLCPEELPPHHRVGRQTCCFAAHLRAVCRLRSVLLCLRALCLPCGVPLLAITRQLVQLCCAQCACAASGVSVARFERVSIGLEPCHDERALRRIRFAPKAWEDGAVHGRRHLQSIFLLST